MLEKSCPGFKAAISETASHAGGVPSPVFEEFHGRTSSATGEFGETKHLRLQIPPQTLNTLPRGESPSQRRRGFQDFASGRPAESQVNLRNLNLTQQNFVEIADHPY